MRRHHALGDGRPRQDEIHCQRLAADLDLMAPAQRMACTVRTPLNRGLWIGLDAHGHLDLRPLDRGVVEGHAGTGEAGKAHSPRAIRRCGSVRGSVTGRHRSRIFADRSAPRLNEPRPASRGPWPVVQILEQPNRSIRIPGRVRTVRVCQTPSLAPPPPSPPGPELPPRHSYEAFAAGFTTTSDVSDAKSMLKSYRCAIAALLAVIAAGAGLVVTPAASAL